MRIDWKDKYPITIAGRQLKPGQNLGFSSADVEAIASVEVVRAWHKAGVIVFVEERPAPEPEEKKPASKSAKSKKPSRERREG